LINTDRARLSFRIGAEGRLTRNCSGQSQLGGNATLRSAAGSRHLLPNDMGRDDFKVDARLLRRGLLDNGYSELPIISDHVVAIDSLPPIHQDPCDRILVAQATVEGVTLLTIDSVVSQYPGPIRAV